MMTVLEEYKERLEHMVRAIAPSFGQMLEIHLHMEPGHMTGPMKLDYEAFATDLVRAADAALSRIDYQTKLKEARIEAEQK
jgi:glycine cleavage system regulatory protein